MSGRDALVGEQLDEHIVDRIWFSFGHVGNELKLIASNCHLSSSAFRSNPITKLRLVDE